MRSSLDTIQAFFACKRIAIVGVSRNPADISVTLFQELLRREYDVVAVTPNIATLMGRKCYARVQDIQPPVEAALLMTSPKISETVVRDCAEAGIRLIWMHRGAGAGAVSKEAVQFCREHGMQVVPGECPFMFLPNTAWFHGFHGMLRKITGRYPAQGLSAST